MALDWRLFMRPPSTSLSSKSRFSMFHADPRAFVHNEVATHLILGGKKRYKYIELAVNLKQMCWGQEERALCESKAAFAYAETAKHTKGGEGRKGFPAVEPHPGPISPLFTSLLQGEHLAVAFIIANFANQNSNNLVLSDQLELQLYDDTRQPTWLEIIYKSDALGRTIVGQIRKKLCPK